MAELYSDVNRNSPNDKPLLKDVEAVYQSLYSILQTRQRERLFSLFGILLEDELFELMDDLAALEILRIVTDTIEDNEPRAVIDFTETNVEAVPDQNKFTLTLVFSLVGFEDQSFRVTQDFRNS